MRTKKLWEQVAELLKLEREKGVLDVSADRASSITAHDAGYIDRENELIVGLQTDGPLKRAIMPNGGLRMVEGGRSPEYDELFSGDRDRHKALTAQALQTTLDCAWRLVRLGKQMQIRYVLVPGWTDAPDEMSRMADYVAGLGPLVEMAEVLPFHQMGMQKWTKLGIEYRLADTPTPSNENAEEAREIFRARGLAAS